MAVAPCRKSRWRTGAIWVGLPNSRSASCDHRLVVLSYAIDDRLFFIKLQEGFE